MKKTRYVVGYDSLGQVVYGQPQKLGKMESLEYTQPVTTLKKAKQLTRKLTTPGVAIAIYKLVRVWEGTSK